MEIGYADKTVGHDLISFYVEMKIKNGCTYRLVLK